MSKSPTKTTADLAGPSAWYARLGAIGDRDGDSADVRLKHRFLVYMAVLMSCGGLVWGSMASYYGLYLPAMIPFGYTVVTALNLAYFRWSKRFEQVRFLQILLSLVLPFLFQYVIGGFASSGAVMLWAMLSIVGALTFTGSHTIIKWLVLYSLLAIVSGAIDGEVSERYAHDGGAAVQTLFFVLNIVLISNITFGLMLYLIVQRERAEEALQDANQQIEGLEEEVRSARRLGQYTLESRLGRGGMGEVYRASHAMLRRPTAIKLLPMDKVGEQSLQRFEQEVQLTAQLTHPNTITVFDYGRTPDGVFYYAMELLEGASLEEIIRADGPQPLGRVVHIIRQAADALSEAHEAGLIHRDIKPANIVLCNYGGKYDHVKVLDFGLVRSIERSDAEGITREGVVAGTPAYLAPEALTNPDNIDHRADLYALGAVAFFMITGEVLFAGKTIAEVCGHHIHTPADAPSARLGRPVHQAVDELVVRCLAKDPEDRPSSARELVRLLDDCVECEPWSERESHAWWQKTGNKLMKTTGAESASARTIDVDLATRGADDTRQLQVRRTSVG